MDYYDLTIIKKHLRVSHDVDDALISDIMAASKIEASNYLNKTIYLDQDTLDAAVADAEALLEEFNIDCAIVLKPSINRAIALLCEYHYYGESALGAEKLKQAAENLLHPDRFLVGW